MKKILSVFLILALLITVLPSQTVSAAVKLNKSKISLNVGDTYQLKLSGSSAKVNWTSSDKKVATVSSKGVVKGISDGKTTITATANNKSYKAAVTVADTEIKLIYTAYLTGDTTIEDYIKDLESENKDAKYEKYDDTHYIYYVKKSEYKKSKEDMKKWINETLNDLKNDESLADVIKSVEYSDDYQKIKVLVDSNKYEFSHAFQIYYQVGILSDLGQTFALINPEDRVCNLSIFDYKTNKEIKFE